MQHLPSDQPLDPVSGPSIEQPFTEARPPAAAEAPMQQAPAATPPPAAPFAPVPSAATGDSRQASSMSKLTWLTIVLTGLLMIRYFVPYVAEEMQYAITRGRERAQLEIARDGLNELPLKQLSTAYQMVSKSTGPSVVHINISSPQSADESELARLLRGRRPRSTGQGSGVIVDEEGYILTNNHVIADSGGGKIQVSLSDGRRVDAVVVGADADTDLAVLKIDADKIQAAQWGDSDDLEVGELVWAVGSPFGLERSITFGILSAKHRARLAGLPHQDFLQTDAAVNPGNSGGPLVDAKGRIVGINTAIVGDSYQGISFAVPSNIARAVYDQIKSDGAVARGWLGVRPIEVTETSAVAAGLDEPKGALIDAFSDDSGPSPARLAGMQRGDVIIRWNGVDIDDATSLFTQVAATAIGSTADVVVMRGGEEVGLQVQIGARPDWSN